SSSKVSNLPQPSSSVSTPAFFAAALARKMAGAPVSRIMLNGPLPFTFTRTRTCLVSVSRYGTSYFLASLAAAGGSAAHDGAAASSPQRATAAMGRRVTGAPHDGKSSVFQIVPRKQAKSPPGDVGGLAESGM